MPDSRITVDHDAESDERLAYVLNHIDGEFKALRKDVGLAIESALAKHMAALAHPEDTQLRPVAIRGADHVGEHLWGRFSKKFTLAVMMAALAVLLAVGTYLAAKLGVLK